MSHTAIITDTDSGLPQGIARKHKIIQVPITIQFGDETFRDVYDIDNPVIFSRMDKDGKFPTTSAPSPGQFAEAFKSAFDSGAESLLCFTVSSEVSATYSSARNATELFPGKEISVIDTRSLSLGQGFMVLAAAQALVKGASNIEAIAIAETVRDRTHLYAALSTLKYLAMSGRVGHLAAGIAGLLDVKPILTILDGKLQLLERVRTQSKSWARTIEIAVGACAGKKIEWMAILHVNALEDAQKFQKLVQSALLCPAEIMVAQMNPGLSIHSGAGLVGVVFVTKQ